MLEATLLALAAAVLHATWNLLVKTSDDRDLAAWGQFAFGGTLFIPVLIYVGLPGVDAIPYLVASSLIHLVYVSALVQAYHHGDFSLAYPLARGSGAIVAAIGGTLLLDDHLSFWAWLAIVVAGAGLASLGIGPVTRASIGWALLTGATIGVYTLIDSAGARRSSGFGYGITLTLITAGVLTVNLLVRGRGPELTTMARREWRRYLVAGACLTGAYSLVLVAVRYAPVGYVAMLRESSVVLGAYAGWALLHERLGGRRVVSSIIIATGLIGLVIFR